MATGKCRVNYKLLACAALFAGNKDVRSYLNLVRVEPQPTGGVLLVATDGHRIVAMLDTSGWADQPMLVEPVKFKVAKHEQPGVAYEDGKALLDGGAVLPAKHWADGDDRGPGRYPNWRQAVPQLPIQAPAGGAYNGHYLGAFAAVPLAYGSEWPIFKVEGDGKSAAVITFAPAVPAFGALMPIREGKGTGETYFQVPDFMNPALLAAAA